MEQSKELTSTNRSCGFAISLRQPSRPSRAGFGLRVRVHTTGRHVPPTTTGLTCFMRPNVSGDDFEEATPDPIPNSEVKLFGADGTAREAVWESRTSPGFFLKGRMPSASALFLFCPRPRARVDELALGRARAPVGWFGATSIARGLRAALGAEAWPRKSAEDPTDVGAKWLIFGEGPTDEGPTDVGAKCRTFHVI